MIKIQYIKWSSEGPNDAEIKGGVYVLTVSEPTNDARVVLDSTVAVPGTADVNYGTGLYVQLDVKNYISGNIEQYRESYMKFDVSGIKGTVTNAGLRLYAIRLIDQPAGQPARPVTVTLYKVPNTYTAKDGIIREWTESEIVYNAKPVCSGKRITENPDNAEEICSVTVSNTDLNKYIDFDISHAVKGDGTYSFAIAKKDAAIPEMLRFCSKESTMVNTKPQLEITYEDRIAPSTPGNLAAVNIKSLSVDLCWDEATDNIAVTGYELYCNATLAAFIPSGTNKYTVRGLMASTDYSFAIKALDAVGNKSPYSSICCLPTKPQDIIAPTAPTQLRNDRVNAVKATISWNAAVDDNEVVRYDIYRGNERIAWVDGHTCQYTATGLTPSTLYSFRVKAIDESMNESDFSNLLELITKKAHTQKPAPPSNLTCIAVTGNMAKINWYTSTDKYDTAGYEIFINDKYSETVTELTVTLSGLGPGKKHAIKVRSVDGLGNKSDFSEISVYSKVTLDNFIAKTYTYNQYVKFINVNTDNGNETVEENVYTRTLPYRLFLPENYDPGIKYPVILFLHGFGESGTDNSTHVALESNAGARVWAEPQNQENYPCIVVAPQTNFGWADKTASEPAAGVQGAIQILAEVENEYSINPEKRYITGTSMGGAGTWDIILRNPGLFAAAIPIAADCDTTKAENVKDMDIWIFHGTIDLSVNVSEGRRMNAALLAAGSSKVKYTEYPSADHGNSWIMAYAEPELIPWTFSKSMPFGHTFPAALSNITVKCYRTSGVVVEWDKPKDNGSNIFYYIVYKDAVKVGIATTTNFYDPAGTISNIYTIKAVNGAGLISAI